MAVDAKEQSVDQVKGARGRRLLSIPFTCVLLYLAVALLLLLPIVRTDGMLTYTLDDAYIHLALAESVAHGHYGINLSEPSSPSSSILWPFLLAPFTGYSWDVLVPFLWNLLFCGVSAWLIGRIVGKWFPATDRDGWLRWFGRLLLAIGLMLAANLEGLTFVGMEHGLQVMLAIACAAGMVEAFLGRPVPGWTLVAAVVGPLVRYENFALVAAVILVLAAQRRWRPAIAIVGLSLAGPLLFSAFLLSHGLPALPSSVMVKGDAYAHATGGFLSSLRHKQWTGSNGAMRESIWKVQALIALVLLILTVIQKQRVRRFVLLAGVLTAVLQLTVGPTNWFHRYEVYALIFTVILTCAAVLEFRRFRRLRFPAIALLLALSTPLYIRGMLRTPDAARGVYQQQYQMHRFVSEFYKRPVAVNDLGYVSYRRPPGVYVLDLWGLASPEAARHHDKQPAWLHTFTAEHNTGLAMIYREWFRSGLPADWSPLARMCVTAPPWTVAGPCVTFYKTRVGDKAFETERIAAFSRSLPSSVRMTTTP